MNWLAHLLLSKKDTEYQLGNFLADPMKGNAWNGASPAVLQGMAMHKAIDSYTDTHAIVSRSKSRLCKKGYLKGVVIDVLFDHYLSAKWEVYSICPNKVFLNRFNVEASLLASGYPPETGDIVLGLVRSNVLSSYRDFGGFVQALKRIDKRLSPRIKAKDCAASYIKIVEQEYDHLKADFELFFPELISFFKQHEFGSAHDHYLVTP